MIGKLLAQGVKLTTLFAAMAPFVAMSFLLGGIDFVTILISLVGRCSCGRCGSARSACFCRRCSSRARCPALVFGAVGIVVLFVIFGVGRTLFFAASAGACWAVCRAAPATGAIALVGAGDRDDGLRWSSLVNLVLLAENRLSLPTEDRVTPLRLGFLAQFLLIAAWTLLVRRRSAARPRRTPPTRSAVLGGLHLALVAMFTVTEDLVVSRRVLLRMTSASRWRWLLAMFGPGGGRGAVYVLVQMALLLARRGCLQPSARAAALARWRSAATSASSPACPPLLFRRLAPARATPLQLRVAVLVLLRRWRWCCPTSSTTCSWQPDVLDLAYFGAAICSIPSGRSPTGASSRRSGWVVDAVR